MTKPKPFELPELISFEGVNHGIFRGALHAEFLRTQYDLVNAADKTKLGISDELMKAWDEQIKLEDEVNKRVNNMALTEQSNEKNLERDGYISTLFGMVNSQRFNPNKEIHKAYKTLADVVQTYHGLQNESMDEKTAHIRGLEIDLAKHTAETAALGVNATIASLHQSNEEFRMLRHKILAHEADTALPRSRSIRKRNDQFFKVVCRIIEVAHYQSTVEADRQAIVELVDKMNRAGNKSRTTHTASAAQQKVASAEEYEKISKLLQPLYAAFERERGMAAGTLAFTGHRRSKNKHLIYELSVGDTNQLLWVRISKDHLVEVKAPAGAAKEARDSHKPSKPKGRKAPETGTDDSADKPSGKQDGENPKNHGSVDIKPKE